MMELWRETIVVSAIVGIHLNTPDWNRGDSTDLLRGRKYHPSMRQRFCVALLKAERIAEAIAELDEVCEANRTTVVKVEYLIEVSVTR